MASTDDLALSDPHAASNTEALIPLFAPYCGGVTHQSALEEAVGLLVQWEWHGERKLEGGRSHAYLLRWTGEPAPLEKLSCHIRFPALPAVAYDFELQAHHLVNWLMLRQEGELPGSFWRWLLLGEPPAQELAAGS